nr:V-set and immunoglobulin domain-containing protein 8 [Pogona vitticeps]
MEPVTLILVFSFYSPALLSAVRINAKGREVLYLAKGDSVKLRCPYELEPQDHGPNGLDIEWTQLNSDPTNLDHVILSYHDQRVTRPDYQRGGSGIQEAWRLENPNFEKNSGSQRLASAGDCCSGLLQRVNFALPDPSQSDASLSLQNVQISDSATYECKVKKTTVATRKVIVMVLERPSVPRCSIAGNKALGREVTLSCISRAGTPQLDYRWAKIADHSPGHGNWFSPNAVKAEGPHPGDLVIRKLSQEDLGVYQCSVANKVGSARCMLEISLSEDSSPASIIVGAVLGSLLFLLLLLCLVVGLVYCCRKKRCKEEASQIRVDTVPPRMKERSRQSSLRSVLGYLPHNISFLQRQKYEIPKEQEGTEMTSPGQEADLISVVDSSRKGNKIHRNDPPPPVVTKANVHVNPGLPSYAQTKSRALMASDPLPTKSDPGRRDLFESEPGAAQGQKRYPRPHGGVPAMVSSMSREGLVV